jgi:hypothetical protein
MPTALSTINDDLSACIKLPYLPPRDSLTLTPTTRLFIGQVGSWG